MATKYLVNKSTKRLHEVNKCGYSKGGNLEPFNTIDEVIEKYGKDLKVCKICKQKSEDLKLFNI